MGERTRVRVRISAFSTPLLMGRGILLGIPWARAAARLIAHVLFGVTPADRLAFAVATAALGAVGGVAGYWPAGCAAKIDPIDALRSK